MKILYIECNMGVSGDMLMSALWELVPDKSNAMSLIKNMGIPGVDITFESKSTCGITGTYARVTVNGVEESDADFAHTHTHSHSHTHRSFIDVKQIISELNVPEAVRRNAEEVYGLIADAESRVHNTDVENIHFHEVGTLDAIADVTVCSYLLYLLGADKIISSPISTGSGTVRCAHGILPVPATATAEILKGIPIHSGDVEGELCTPTGAALIKKYAGGFSSMPAMVVDKIGCGIGSREYERANCVRIFAGSSDDGTSDTAVELACNIDDMTAEELSFACEVLLQSGALDVCQYPAAMKKSRLGTVLSVLCRESDRQKMLSLIFKHTSTIGVREYSLNRYTMSRTVKRSVSDLGEIGVKYADGYGISKKKAEFDDLKKIALENEISLNDVRKSFEY